MFLAELSDLQLWGADVGNSYLQASQKRSFTLWLGQNLMSCNDMFLLCTKHSMTDYLEEHVGMTSSLTFLNKWNSMLENLKAVFSGLYWD